MHSFRLLDLAAIASAHRLARPLKWVLDNSWRASTDQDWCSSLRSRGNSLWPFDRPLVSWFSNWRRGAHPYWNSQAPCSTFPGSWSSFTNRITFGLKGTCSSHAVAPEIFFHYPSPQCSVAQANDYFPYCRATRHWELGCLRAQQSLLALSWTQASESAMARWTPTEFLTHSAAPDAASRSSGTERALTGSFDRRFKHLYFPIAFFWRDQEMLLHRCKFRPLWPVALQWWQKMATASFQGCLAARDSCYFLSLSFCAPALRRRACWTQTGLSILESGPVRVFNWSQQHHLFQRQFAYLGRNSQTDQ